MATKTPNTHPKEKQIRVETTVANAITSDESMAFRLPDRFAAINRIITRDLNNPRCQSFFAKYSKNDIKKYLSRPQAHSRQLREVVTYLYGASSHFHRLIQYFVGLSDLAYVVAPYRLDTTNASVKTIRGQFKRVLNLMSAIDVKNQLEKILTVCLREDVFYGTIRETTDSIIIQQLPSDYCSIAVIEDNVLNVSFDFSYFTKYPSNLPLYPQEFATKYEIYKSQPSLRWQELSAPNSFAVKANKEILAYPLPPFAGILREIYDIEDYKDMKMTKTDIENYALLVMQLGVDENGNWTMDYKKAREFWSNLDGVLPEEIGSVLSPMPINKISFERTHTGDADSVAEAEQNLFTAAGVSSLLFNNEKASSNALLLSIKADQAMTYSIVKSIEGVLNRFIHRHSFGKRFKVTFLDCSPFNRKELGDAYLKACTYGLPFVSYYCASQGLMQDEMDGMNYLEDNVLGVKERFKPLQSSATQSASSDEAGRPLSDDGDLTDAGEQSREAGE